MGAFGLYLFVCSCLGYALVYPPRLFHPKCPAYLSEAKLAGTGCWVSPPRESGKAIFILLHEHIGNRSRWLPMAKRLVGAGYGVIVPALPGHQGHPDRKCGFGIAESQMAAEIVDWARGHFPGSSIILGGVSLGGAASWMASGLSTPDGVFSEGCFTNMEEGMRDWFHMLFPGAYFLLGLAHRLALRWSGLDPLSIDPLSAASKWRGKPCAVFHGERDREFPIERGERLAMAAGTVLWRIPRSGHLGGQRREPERYFARLLELAAECDAVGQGSTRTS